MMSKVNLMMSDPSWDMLPKRAQRFLKSLCKELEKLHKGDPARIDPHCAPTQEMLDRCMAIIGPKESLAPACLEELAGHFFILMYVRANPKLFDRDFESNIHRKTLATAEAVLRAAVMMKVFTRYANDVNDIGNAIDEATKEKNEKKWNETAEYLESAGLRLFRGLNKQRRTTRPVDVLKRFCALSAYKTLESYGAAPTLSGEGTFYQLAMTFYEAVTGCKEASVERQCRAIFGHERRANGPQ
jgi:hypothetical protein